MARRKAQSGEFAWISRYFAPLAREPGAFALTDDAAVLPARPGYEIVVTKDAIVAGVHFLETDAWDLVARKLLRVNLSDLAAKGAEPFGYLLMTAFPKGTTEPKVSNFTRGLAADQREFGLSLYGGDTVSTPGPATFACSMFGWVRRGRILLRSGARVGDHVWVTGTIGDAGAGLKVLTGMPAPDPVARRLARNYWLPRPPVTFGLGLLGLAHAAMDVSDGLLQDAGHMSATSGVQISLELAAVPLSKDLLSLWRDPDEARIFACAAGDDYQILFTAAPRAGAALISLAAQHKIRVTRIGSVSVGEGVTILNAAGRPIPVTRGGYTHF